jgi:GNAT superfamily N-acetyltransferase
VLGLEQLTLHGGDGNAVARSDRPGQARPVPITIEGYEWASDLPPRDVADATRIGNDVWAEWVPGERPISDAAFVDEDRFTARPERVVRQLARDEAGRVVAHGYLEWREGPGACVLRLFVDPARRRAAGGRQLAGSLVDVARSEGRSGVTVQAAPGSPGDAACRAAGLRPDLVVEQNRASTAGIDAGLLEQWREAGEAATDYELVAYDAPCPDDDLAAGAVRARHAMNDAPRFEGEVEATYTVEELRAVEDAVVAAHIEWWSVVVRHRASGEAVGISEMYLATARPWMVFQGDTGVDPAHRGHGLGAWMKAVNHLRLARERPEVELVQTWNAAANEPMLRINRALGFAPVQRYRGWFLPLA